MAAIRLDKLAEGTGVMLNFHVGKRIVETSEARFVRMEGEGEDRHAVFRSRGRKGKNGWYEWEAYRYKGRWAYGSSADLITVHSIL